MAATRTFNADARGFTLTELLVGMLLTLVVTGGALLAFDQAIRGTDMARLRLGMGDQVRIGLDLMTRDFIQIGNGLPNGKVMPVPNGTGAGAIHRPGPSLADFPLGATTDISAVIPGAQLGPIINGVQSDVISMLYVDPAFDNPAVAAENPRHCTMANNGRTCVFATNVGTILDELRAGDLLMVTGTGTTMMMVTSVSPANTAHFDDGDAMNLNQPAAPSGSVARINPTPGVAFDVVVERVKMVTYWIQAQSENDSYELMRQINFGTAQRVASGLEYLQYTYDMVDGVTNPTNVRNPADPTQIRKVNIFLAARSSDRFKNTNDFLRMSMSSQVSLRSLALVDRYQ
jgi:Tfp pilus assembly protein PilW